MPYKKGQAMTYIAPPKAPKETVTELRRRKDELTIAQRKAREALYAADHALRMNEVALATQKSIAQGHKLYKVKIKDMSGAGTFYTFSKNEQHIRDNLWHYMADVQGVEITYIGECYFVPEED